MAKIIPLRPEAPQAKGPRAWLGRLRAFLDRLVYQLVRLPSRRAAGARNEARERVKER